MPPASREARSGILANWRNRETTWHLPPLCAPRQASARALPDPAMSDLFGSRLRASESSYAREDDKVRLKKLRDYLIKSGHLKEEDLKPKAREPSLTVDVMSSISANELPIRDLSNSVAVANSTAVVRRSVVNPPDLERGAPELPTTSAVVSEIYQEHMGRNW